MDGKLVDWDDAQVHVLTHTLHYGLGAFEGIRSYKQSDGHSAVFRLREHMRRLLDSCHIGQMACPYSIEDLCKGAKDTLTANGLEAGYIRPVVYIGDGGMGVFPGDNPIRVFIATWKWGAYLGKDALEKGIRAKIKTSPLTCVLPGITRDTIMTLAREHNIPIEEQRFSRDELYIADEAFFTGTAAEVTPIREVDGRKIGKGEPGPITKKLKDKFFEVVQGRNPKYASWLDPYVVQK